MGIGQSCSCVLAVKSPLSLRNPGGWVGVLQFKIRYVSGLSGDGPTIIHSHY